MKISTLLELALICGGLLAARALVLGFYKPSTAKAKYTSYALAILLTIIFYLSWLRTGLDPIQIALCRLAPSASACTGPLPSMAPRNDPTERKKELDPKTGLLVEREHEEEVSISRLAATEQASTKVDARYEYSCIIATDQISGGIATLETIRSRAKAVGLPTTYSYDPIGEKGSLVMRLRVAPLQSVNQLISAEAELARLDLPCLATKRTKSR